jgi:hypothetical protein
MARLQEQNHLVQSCDGVQCLTAVGVKLVESSASRHTNPTWKMQLSAHCSVDARPLASLLHILPVKNFRSKSGSSAPLKMASSLPGLEES